MPHRSKISPMGSVCHSVIDPFISCMLWQEVLLWLQSTLSVDQVIVNSDITMFSDAVRLMFASYYCLNISYPADQGATLEFVQRCLWINPEKRSRNQKAVSPKVLHCLTKLQIMNGWSKNCQILHYLENVLAVSLTWNYMLENVLLLFICSFMTHLLTRLFHLLISGLVFKAGY